MWRWWRQWSEWTKRGEVHRSDCYRFDSNCIGINHYCLAFAIDSFIYYSMALWIGAFPTSSNNEWRPKKRNNFNIKHIGRVLKRLFIVSVSILMAFRADIWAKYWFFNFSIIFFFFRFAACLLMDDKFNIRSLLFEILVFSISIL